MTHARARAAAALVPVLLAGLLATAAAPAQANFVGTGQDPAGDAAGPHPGLDVVGVGLTYDRRTGALRGGVRFAAPLSNDVPANLQLIAGRRTATGCNGYPAVGFVTQTDQTGVNWLRATAAGPPRWTGRAVKLYEATTEDYEAIADELEGVRPDCVVATLTAPDDVGVVYDVAGPFRLRGLPELELAFGRVETVMRAGRPQRIRVTLHNAGDGSTGRLRLAVAGARGLTARLPRSIPALRPGARRTVTLDATLSSRARQFTTLRVTATGADRLRATIEDDVYLGSAPRDGSGGGGGEDARLCYGYTWTPPYAELRPC